MPTYFSPIGVLNTTITDAVTNTTSVCAQVRHRSTGPVVTGFGVILKFFLQSSTGADRSAADINITWRDAIDATRATRMRLHCYDGAVSREFLRGDVWGGTVTTEFRGDPPANTALARVLAVGELAAGSAGGTVYGANAAVGFAGDLEHYQLGGVTVRRLSAVGALTRVVADAATTTVTTSATVAHTTSATAGDGFGLATLFQLEDGGGTPRSAARQSVLWATAAAGTRKAALVWSVFDTAEREGLRISTDGAAASVSLGGALAHASAQFQGNATTKGWLGPRWTTPQRDAIATPAEGLFGYNTTNKQPEYYNGTSWGSYALGSAAMALSFPLAQGAAGTTQIAAASPGNKHKVVGGIVTLSTDGTIKFIDGSGDLTGTMDVAAKSGFVIPASVLAMIETSTVNTALSIVTTGGAAKGVVRYLTEP